MFVMADGFENKALVKIIVFWTIFHQEVNVMLFQKVDFGVPISTNTWSYKLY